VRNGEENICRDNQERVERLGERMRDKERDFEQKYTLGVPDGEITEELNLRKLGERWENEMTNRCLI